MQGAGSPGDGLDELQPVVGAGDPTDHLQAGPTQEPGHQARHHPGVLVDRGVPGDHDVGPAASHQRGERLGLLGRRPRPHGVVGDGQTTVGTARHDPLAGQRGPGGCRADAHRDALLGRGFGEETGGLDGDGVVLGDTGLGPTPVDGPVLADLGLLGIGRPLVGNCDGHHLLLC